MTSEVTTSFGSKPGLRQIENTQGNQTYSIDRESTEPESGTTETNRRSVVDKNHNATVFLAFMIKLIYMYLYTLLNKIYLVIETIKTAVSVTFSKWFYTCHILDSCVLYTTIIEEI